MSVMVDAARIRESLATDPASSPIGWRVEHYERIGSTNDRARELAASGEPEGTVVIADEQTAGRGRGARAWHSPGGLGLYLSVILRPDAPPSAAPIFGLLAGVACAEALRRVSDGVGIKWPNDVMAPREEGRPDRKIAGILAESRTGPETVRDVVVGIGINVGHTPADFPEDLRDRSASIRMLTETEVDRTDVALSVLVSLRRWYTLWEDDGSPPVLRGYEKLARDIHGRRVRVDDGSAVWVGTTDGLSADGALRVIREESVEPDSGRVHTVRYGELVRVEEA